CWTVTARAPVGLRRNYPPALKQAGRLDRFGSGWEVFEGFGDLAGKSDGELQMKSESRVMLHKIALMGVIAGVGAPSAFLAPAPLDAAPAQSQVDAAHCARLKGSRLGGVLIEQAERIAQGAPLSKI